MLKLSTRTGLALGLAGTAALSLVLGSTARADSPGARSGDIVGVGSDTVQNAADFVFDGDPVSGGGYNLLNNNHRVLSFDATGDANGRATFDGSCGTTAAATGIAPFCDSTTNQQPNLLTGSVVIVAGQKPVVRPNGSGKGVGALIADSGAGYQGLPTGSLQFARMSRLPNSTEIGNCPTSSTTCGGLHVYQFGTDNLAIAHQASAYNGPAGLSADELYKIFVTCTITTWGQLGVTGTAANNVIHPLIPQSGSGTRSFFLSTLQQAENLTTTLTPGSCTRTVEEHDPTGIYGDPAPADAIEPFSTGKIKLINSGYFANGAGYMGTSFANGAYTPNYLTYLGAGATTPPATPDAGTNNPAGSPNVNYNDTRGLFFTIRQVDLGSTTPIQAGGTANFAQFLFAGFTNNGVTVPAYISRSAAQTSIGNAGFTAAYKDCGINPTTC